MKLRLTIFSALVGSAGLWLLAGSPDTRRWTPPPGPHPKLALATFAGGCFWCLETAFEGFPGVYSATSGYAGGKLKNPSYEQVSSGGTGHAEAVQVGYDPSVVSYEQLLEVFWHNVDPTDGSGQFCDRGSQYRSAVFFAGEEQRKAALASKQAIASSGRLKQAIVTEIVPLEAFYPAEAYHQDFYKKDPVRYKTYRLGCGRDRRLKELWGDEAGTHWPVNAGRTGASSTKGWPAVKDGRWTKPPKDELKARLTPLQFNVTQQEGTEPPFRNEYWNNHEPGLYVDVVSGEPLFSSLDKFDSGSGWPSFTRPVPKASLASRTDLKLGMPRTEVRSKHADSHLGHVFDDGPAPTGQRYCINSAALRFVPLAQLEAEGYGEYKALFEQKANK